MREKFNRIIAGLLIICMTFANILLLGNSVAIAVNEELEAQANTTTEGNINFDAYFKQDTKQIHQKELKISGEEETLYIQVKVKDKVSISNAKIQIENANFKIDKEKTIENRYVQEINEETNEIELTAISSNNEVILELPIKFQSKETVSESYFNQENNLVLTGKYKDIDQNEKDLNGEVKIRTTWADEPEVELTQSIDKYFSLGELGLVLQQKVATQVKNNILPRSEEKLDINVPELENELPENVIVLVNGEKLKEENITYTKETGIVEINNKKEEDENKEISWGDGACQYTIIYKYSNKIADVERDISLITKASTKLFTKEKSIEKENEQNTHIQKAGNVATTKTEITGEIYKGYMYAESEKEIKYDEKNEIEVSYLEGISEINFNTNENAYISAKEQEVSTLSGIRYISTSINKNEMLDVLGQDGSMFISNENGEAISTINKESQTDEKGFVVFNYNGEYTNVNIKTTEPIKEGKITINNVKGLKGKTGYTKSQIKDFVKLKNTATIETNISKEIASSAIELKEPTTEAKIEVNKETLSTMKTNKDIELKAILNSNSPKYDLYTNAKLEIEMPQDITNVEVTNISVLYGDGLEVKPILGTQNGKQVIKIVLNGKQTQYIEEGIEGITIVINANLTLNNKATSKEDNFVMTYENANANQYLEEAEKGIANAKVNVVSPKGLITTNNIKSLEIETIGEEKGVSQKLEKSTNEKEIKVEQEIINNNEGKIENVRILGTFGTNGTTEIDSKKLESNVGETLKTALNIETENANKLKIYYSQNENATDDLTNAQNKWQENITDTEKTRKYLIAVENMEPAESLVLNYNASIPANLEYNQQNYQTYTATYTETSTGTSQSVDATAIELTTGQGPVVEATLSARVGNEDLKDGDEVKEGEVIKYIVTVKNTGNEDASSVNVTGFVPEGTVLVEPTAEYEYKDYYYDEIAETEKNISVGNVKAGGSSVVSYEVRVKNGITDGSTILNKVRFKYNEVTKDSNVMNVTVKNGDIKVENKRSLDTSIGTYSPGSMVYIAYITNSSTVNKKDLSIAFNLSAVETLSSVTISKFDGSYVDVSKEDLLNTEKIDIGDLEGNQRIIIKYSTEIKSTEGDGIIVASLKAKEGENQYRSNEIKNDFIGVSFDCNIDVDKSEILKSNDEVTYTVTVNNKTLRESNMNLEILKQIPNELQLKQVLVNGVEKVFYNEDGSIRNPSANSNITIVDEISKNGTITVKYKCVVREEIDRKEAITITNKATILINGLEKETNQVTNIIATEENNNNNNDNDNPGENPNDNNNNETKNIIAGVAWKDENKNGIKDENEQILSGINVKLFNLETNDIAKNNTGIINETTKENGTYILNNVPNGNYLVIFEYDTGLYKATVCNAGGVSEDKNSNAIEKQLTINNETKKYGVTDSININNTNKSNINIGLIELKEFNIRLDKYISKVIIQNSNSTKKYEYENTNFAKIEIPAKTINNSNVVIEYSIVLTNIGDIEGYIKNIVDYVPKDLNFNSEMNKDWYQDGENLYNSSLKNEKLLVGEKKEVKLILTKKMNENNTGLITNTAEIADSYNEYGVKSKNSLNKDVKEEDMGSAEVIISVSTGIERTLIVLVLIGLIIGLITIIFIKRNQ